MISYGDAIQWCIQKKAVIRFVNQDSRPEFFTANHRSGVALELAINVDGRTVAAHCPVNSGKDPSQAVAVAVISCVQYFVERKTSALVSPITE